MNANNYFENNIENLWVGLGRNSKINRVLFLPANNFVKENVAKSYYKSYRDFVGIKDDILPLDRELLILEECYYLGLDEIDEDHYLTAIRKLVFNDDSLTRANLVINLKKTKKNSIEKQDVIKFIIIQETDKLIFYQ